MTLDELAPRPAALDLAHATVSMRGPAAALEAAFAALGRTPVYVQPARVEDDGAARATSAASASSRRADELSLSDLTPPLTEQREPTSVTLALAPAYITGRVMMDGRISGFSLAAQLGYRLDAATAVGVRASIGWMDGTYPVRNGMITADRAIETMPLGFSAFVRATGYDRVWGAAFLGLNLEYVAAPELGLIPAWHRSLGFGAEGGVDLLRLDRHRLGIYGRIDGALLSDTSYTAFALGVAYRR